MSTLRVFVWGTREVPLLPDGVAKNVTWELRDWLKQNSAEFLRYWETAGLVNYQCPIWVLAMSPEDFTHHQAGISFEGHVTLQIPEDRV